MDLNDILNKIIEEAEYCDLNLKTNKGESFAGIRYQFFGVGFNKIYLMGKVSIDENNNFHITDPQVYETLKEALKEAIISFTGTEKFDKYDSNSEFICEIEKHQRVCNIEILPSTDNSDGQKHIQDNDFFKYLNTVIEQKSTDSYCSCGEQLVKELRSSPQSSWFALAGRQGWFTFCPKCGLIHGGFECTMMS